MTDRVKGFVVTLENDLRDDDAEAVAEAIRMVRGVGAVSAHTVNVDDVMNRMRVRMELEEQLLAVLRGTP